MVEILKGYPWDKREAYADYLVQTFYYVKHSTRLLNLAASRIPHENARIYNRFNKHVAEENNHDFDVKKDIKNLGFDFERFCELPQTRMFWETQYYKIEHLNPLVLMGYILALEAAAVDICPFIQNRVEPLYGRESSRFIRVHAEDDPDHLDKAIEVIESLEGETKKLVYQNLEQSALAYIGMIKALLSKHNRASASFSKRETGKSLEAR